jgi:FdhD protein
MASSVQSVDTIKVRTDQAFAETDLIVTEEPLEIRIGYGQQKDRSQFTLSVTMRTPGNDEELCLGFLYSEGIIQGKKDVMTVKYCGIQDNSEEKDNVMRVELFPHISFDPAQFNRNFYTASSCGVCGKASIESLSINCDTLNHIDSKISSSMLFELPDKLQQAQMVFGHTGGLHASGLFDLHGNMLMLMEDVGRHNALDKLVGSFLMKESDPFAKAVLVLTGRISFDLVQKAVRAGIPMIAAVGAPSSLAVDVAKTYGITLIGFLKEDKFNVYCKKQRVELN